MEIEKILECANKEIGYLEKSKTAYVNNPEVIYSKTDGAGSDNITKYSKEMDDLNVYNTKKNGYAWCNIFIDWLFVQAVGEARAMELLIGFSAGCTQDWNWNKAKGRLVTNPKRGDLIFFGDLSHIGIIEKVENDIIYTIEGNTSNKAELIVNGGTVTKKQYNINSKVIYGYVRPPYDESSQEPKPVFNLIKKGDRGTIVMALQQKLIQKGYIMSKYGADGIFGDETEKVVKELQRDAGIGIDGIVGEETLAVLESDFMKPNQEEYPGYIIKRGQINDNVKKIQERLIQKGYNVGSSGADGIFGKNTYSAVVQFQSDFGLSVDGIVGINTWTTLFN